MTRILPLVLILASGSRLFSQQKDRLNGHRVVLDDQGKLFSWMATQERAYGEVVMD